MKTKKNEQTKIELGNMVVIEQLGEDKKRFVITELDPYFLKFDATNITLGDKPEKITISFMERL